MRWLRSQSRHRAGGLNEQVLPADTLNGRLYRFACSKGTVDLYLSKHKTGEGGPKIHFFGMSNVNLSFLCKKVAGRDGDSVRERPAELAPHLLYVCSDASAESGRAAASRREAAHPIRLAIDFNAYQNRNSCSNE